MWCREVSAETFFAESRWTVSYFSESLGAPLSAYPMVRIAEIASERRGSADPQQLGDVLITYLGLENVRSQTGELVDFELRSAKAVKSRSKVFEPGDVLFGRLRPELNKVFLADGPVQAGLCSGEFIVLVPDTLMVEPRYLRHLLASEFVSRYARKLTAGASLPRMSAEDLLNLGIPLPPLDEQRELVERLKAADDEIIRLRHELATLPSAVANALLNSIASGRPALAVD